MEFMNRKMFKLSVVSSAILATTQVSAALYNVVEVSSGQSTDVYKSSYGVAIEPADTSDDATNNCFEESSSILSSCSSFKLAGETRLVSMNSGEAVDGLSYREEAPFAMNRQFNLINTYDDFENYCEAQLGYSTCNQWASVRWNIWSAEINRDTTPNSIAFIEDSAGNVSSVDSSESLNVVVNSISDNGVAIGIQSEPGNVTEYRRNSVEALSSRRGCGGAPA